MSHDRRGHVIEMSVALPLPVNLRCMRLQCGRGHTSDALFCQACGTRLVEG